MRKQTGKKIFDEHETRAHLLDLGREFGFEGDLLIVFNKFDSLLKKCTNQEEKDAITFMAVEEINKIIDPGKYQGYNINGMDVLGKDQIAQQQRKLIKGR